jgi:hypothetical protein
VQVDQAVPGDLYLEEEMGAPALDITGWRTAIETGLSRGRDGAFAKPSAAGGAWRVVVLEAVPRLVVQDVDDTGRAVLFTGAIAWRARLFDPLMQPIGDGAGTAQVPGSFRGVSDASPLLNQGIEMVVVEILRFVDQEIARTLAGTEVTPEK